MRPLALVLALAAASPVLGQDVTFRSGDHPDFARLVLDIQPGTGWTIGRLGADYAVELEGAPDFDLSNVYERIPRTRLGEIEVTDVPGRLRLRLACECHVTGFLFRPDKLVIDVADGPAPPGSPWEQPIDGAQPLAPRTVSVGSGPIPLLGTLPPPDLSLFPPARGQTDDALLPFDEIAADMALAVASGLLDAPEVRTALPAAPGEAIAVTPAAPSGPEADRPGVNFITAGSVDRLPDDLRALSNTGQPCLPESDFDLAAWAPTGDFGTDIGALRAAVIDEAGAPDEETITALARAYLHYGFGLEARQSLELTSADSTASRLIGLLADIIDGRPVPHGVFADQAGCYTPVALWSALADGTLDGRSEQERTAIEMAHRVLPPGPSQAVTPRLAGLFLAAGQTEAAAEMMGRLPEGGTTTEEALGIGSDIVRTAASAAAAREELLAALQNGSRSSAGTTMRLVDATIAAGLVPETWMIETLAALRFENRGTEVATDLAATEIRARIAAADFAGGAALLSDEDLQSAPDIRAGLLTEFAGAIADRGTDAEFISYVFDESTEMPDPVPTAVPSRLTTLGFPDVALAMLDTPPGGEGTEERRLLRAEALRALGREEEAELLLAGSGEETAPSDDAAWQQGDWDTLRTSTDPLLTEAAEAMLTAPPPSPDGSLASRSALIAEAEATRALARDLLTRFPEPEGDTTP